jgi:hypothetical protein
MILLGSCSCLVKILSQLHDDIDVAFVVLVYCLRAESLVLVSSCHGAFSHKGQKTSLRFPQCVAPYGGKKG